MPAITDFTQAQSSDVLVHDTYVNNIAGEMAGAPPAEEIFATAACVVKETIHQA